MTTNTATYGQAIAAQERLVRRGMLAPTQTHEIVDALERPEYGSVWLTCSCRKHFAFKVDDSERAERVYAAHVLESLRISLGLAA